MFEKAYAQIAEKASRPEVKDLKRSFVEILLHVVAAALLIVYWGSAIYGYQKGRAGDTQIVFSTIATMVYFFLMIPELIPPREYNYPVKITEENARVQYRTARIFMGCFRGVTVALFFPMTLPGWSFRNGLWLVLALCIPSMMAYYVYWSKRARQG
jgi:hypothetical protein